MSARNTPNSVRSLSRAYRNSSCAPLYVGPRASARRRCSTALAGIALIGARRCASARPAARHLLALRGNEQRELLMAVDSVLRVCDAHVSHSDTNQLHSLDYSVLRRITSE